MRPHRRAVATALASSVAATTAELIGPVLVGAAVDAVLGRDRPRLATIAVAYAVVTAALLVARIARGRLAARASEAFLADLREQVVTRLLCQPLRFFDRHSAGTLLARATTDVDRLSRFVRESLPALLDAVLLLLVTTIVLVAASWQLAAVTLLYLPGQAVAVRRYQRASRPAYASFAEAEGTTTAAIAETIAARTTLQGLGATDQWADSVARVDDALLVANDAAISADNRLSVLGLWQQLALAAVVLLGGVLASTGDVSVGVIATFALALRQLFGPLDSLAWCYADAQQAGANLARILEVLDLPASDDEDADGAADGSYRSDGPVAGLGLALDGVRYRYDDHAAPALVDVTLHVAPGERVAVVGPTGSGKSTLAKLAAGLLHPEHGAVCIGGYPVAAWSPDALRRAVVLLPQEGVVVRGTLADNLRLVPGVHSDAALADALSKTGLGGWLGALPGGLDAAIADRGANLSAGERQLIALARVALADPAVVILDEATADVDPRTEALVAGALDRLTVGRTVLVVAHRPETARRCSRIVALDGGSVVPVSTNGAGPT